MSEAKHTPGPWQVGYLSGRHPSMICTAGTDGMNGESIASVYGMPVNAHIDEIDHERYARQMADARLIAAAPEMRDLLEMASTALWAKGANGEARKIDQFLDGLG